MSLPDHEFLPGPFWLLTILHLATLTLHFAAMNFLVGGLLIVLFGRFENRWQDPTVRRFVKLFPSVMAVTVSFGVAPLLFLQVVYHRQVYSSAIVSGWFWLMIGMVATISYYLLYGASFEDPAKIPGRKPVYLLVALLGLIFISLVYSNVMSLAEQPAMLKQLYAADQSGWGINPDLSWLLRWLHMILGAMTVGGYFVGVLSWDNPPARRLGQHFFTFGAVVASLVGAAYMITLKDALIPLMRTPAAWVLLLALTATAAAIVLFNMNRMLLSGISLGLSLLGMIVIRHYLRLVRLGEDLQLEAVPVRSEWGLFLIFLVCFLVAIGTIAWMIHRYVRSENTPAVPVD